MNSWRILFIIFLILLFSAGGVYFIIHFQKKSEAANENVLHTENLTQGSDLKKTEGTIYFDLYTDESVGNTVTQDEEALFETKTANDGAILEFIKRSPLYDPNVIEDKTSAESDVKGIFFNTQTSTRESLIPPGFEARLFRRFEDKDDPTVEDKSENKIHHYYEQKINDIPVYSAVLAVHVKESNKIYSASGTLITNTEVPPARISSAEAEEKALEQAQKEIGTPVSVSVSRSEEYIFNKKVLGLSDDNNYLTQAITVVAQDVNIPFAMMYFVDLTNGAVIHTQTVLQDVMNRNIFHCAAGTCASARAEGAAAHTNADVNKVYDYLGETYNLYSTMFDRDSFDDAGAPLKGYANQFNFGQFKCPNAAWFGSRNGGDDTMRICTGMASKDVMAHEMTHAVTERTAGLVYQNQSGALNEAMSDIFGYGVDSDEWTLGEDSSLGMIRRLDEPTQSRTPQPDRLFAPQYHCAGTDSGGVHVNSGVINKAFYLMTVGGSFNGCTITGVGKDKSLAVAYRALTTYLRPTSNFKAAYNAFMQACTDLYADDGETCNQIRNALQSVEIDQQPEASSTSPKCSSTAGTPATCATNANNPTVTIPAPTATSSTVTVTPGPSITPAATVTPTTIPTNSSLKLTLKLQGITSKPAASSSAVIKVIVSNTSGHSFTGSGTFTVGDTGIWTGSVPVAIPADGSFSLFVKGPVHIQKKICETAPTETSPGTYRCKADQSLQLKKGENVFDFSNIVLLAGDLDVQDGVVNAADVALIRNNLGSTNADILKKADVNRDNIIDTQDHSIVIAALSFRFDEE